MRIMQLCEYTKYHGIVHFKGMNFMVYELYLSRTLVTNLIREYIFLEFLIHLVNLPYLLNTFPRLPLIFLLL